MPRSSTVGATSKKAAAEQRRQQDYTSAANGKDYANSSGTSAGSSRTGSGSGSSSGGGRTGAGAPINKGILKHHQGGFVGVDDEFPPLPGRGAGRHLALAEDTKLPPAFAACAICGEEKPLGARCLTEKCGLTYCSACFAIPFLPSLVGDQCLLDATPTQDARGSRGSSRFGRGRSSSDQGGEPDELDDSQLDDSQNERRAAGLESSQNDDDEEEKETNVHLMDADGILFSKPQRATCFTCRQPLSVPRKGVGSTAPPSGDIKTKTCWNKIRQPQRPQVSDEGEQHLAPHHICDDEETTLLELLNRGVELLSVPQRHALKALKSTLQRSLVAYAMLLFWYTFRLQPLHDWEVKQQSEHRKNHHGTSQEQKKHKGERMWDNDAEDMHMTSGTGNDPASDEASCRYTPEAMAVSVSGRHANYYLGLEDTESDLFNKLTNIRFLRLLTDAFEPDGTSLQFGDAAELHWHGPQWKRQYREVFQKHMRRSMWRVALFSLREKFKKVYSVDPVTATFENDEQMTEDQFLIALEKDWSSKVQEATGKYEEARTTPLARAEQEEQELLAALLFADEASDFGEGGMMNQAMVAQQMRELRHYQQMAEEEKYKREREASMQSSHGGSMDHDSTMNESDSTNPTTSSGAEASSGKRSCTSKKAKGPGDDKHPPGSSSGSLWCRSTTEGADEGEMDVDSTRRSDTGMDEQDDHVPDERSRTTVGDERRAAAPQGKGFCTTIGIIKDVVGLGNRFRFLPCGSGLEGTPEPVADAGKTLLKNDEHVHVHEEKYGSRIGGDTTTTTSGVKTASTDKGDSIMELALGDEIEIDHYNINTTGRRTTCTIKQGASSTGRKMSEDKSSSTSGRQSIVSTAQEGAAEGGSGVSSCSSSSSSDAVLAGDAVAASSRKKDGTSEKGPFACIKSLGFFGCCAAGSSSSSSGSCWNSCLVKLASACGRITSSSSSSSSFNTTNTIITSYNSTTTASSNGARAQGEEEVDVKEHGSKKVVTDYIKRGMVGRGKIISRGAASSPYPLTKEASCKNEPLVPMLLNQPPNSEDADASASDQQELGHVLCDRQAEVVDGTTHIHDGQHVAQHMTHQHNHAVEEIQQLSDLPSRDTLFRLSRVVPSPSSNNGGAQGAQHQGEGEDALVPQSRRTSGRAGAGGEGHDVDMEVVEVL
ncbi:unnamed protein product [Amoebophrya sp. A25]|nr:unnamed protein product [Amoebophrya sp. A25]|eukprot:GSA25T00014748001.1